MLQKGDRVEIVPRRGANHEFAASWWGRRGHIVSIEDKWTTAVIPLSRYTDVRVHFDGDDSEFNYSFAPEECRKLSLLELLAEAAQ